MMGTYLALFVAFISASRIVWFMPSLGNGYYFILVFILLLLLISNGTNKLKINMQGMVLIVVCTMSILLNDIPYYYRPWLRLGLFCTVTFLVGPFLKSPILSIFRKSLFWNTLLINTVIALVSFIGRTVGISRMQGNFWCGITNHSMIMGIVAGNAGVYLLMLLTNIKSLNSKQRWIIGGILVLCLLMMLGAASRSSILAFLAGGIITLLISMKQSRIKIMKIAMVTFVVLFFLSQYLERYTVGIQQKNKGDVMVMNIESRAALWEKGWQTFCDNPLVGVGFSAMEVDMLEDDTGLTHTGQVEPGSSWLAVLSMTGMFGGIAIILILIRGSFQLCSIYRKNVPIAATLYGLFAFYLVHMCAEGYIFAGGSMSCLNFWLLMGTIDAYATDGNLAYSRLGKVEDMNGFLSMFKSSKTRSSYTSI